MAVYGANESTVTALLKEVYPGAVTEQLNEEVGPWAVVEKQPVKLAQGEQIIETMHVGRNQGIGVRGDNERLPNAGKQRHLQASIKLPSVYIMGEFSSRVVRGTHTDKSAFAQVAETEMRRSIIDFTNDIARQVATGHGRLAKITAAAANGATTVTVDSILNLGVDQRVVVYSGTQEQSPAFDLANDTGGHTITAINPATNAVTIAPAVNFQTTGISSGAYIYRAGNFNGTTVKEVQGLATIIGNTGDYFGINRDNEYELQANVKDMTGIVDADFEDALQEGSDIVAVRGGNTVDLYYTDFKTRRRFLKQLQKQRQYTVTGGAPSFAGGNGQSNKELSRGLRDGLTHNGVPFIASRRIDPGTIYGLDTSTFVAFEQSELEWVANGDSVLHSLLASEQRDAYRFAAFKDMQLFNRKPNANIKFVNAS